jgi:hypothetical protein
MAAGKIQIADARNAKYMDGPVIAKPIPGKTKIPEPIIELILIVIMENNPNLLSKLAKIIPYFFLLKIFFNLLRGVVAFFERTFIPSRSLLWSAFRMASTFCEIPSACGSRLNIS